MRLSYHEVGALKRGPITVNDALRLCFSDYYDEKSLVVVEALAINLVYARIVMHGNNRVGVITGTKKFRQWRRYNLAFWPSVADGDTRRWHRGFLEYAQTVYAFYKGKGLTAVCGHSLGAAAVQIVAPSLVVPGIAFASPRPLVSAKPYHTPDVLNILRNDDWITKLPFTIPPFYWPKHVGRAIKFYSKGRHRGEDHRTLPYSTALSGYERGTWETVQ